MHEKAYFAHIFIQLHEKLKTVVSAEENWVAVGVCSFHSTTSGTF